MQSRATATRPARAFRLAQRVREVPRAEAEQQLVQPRIFERDRRRQILCRQRAQPREPPPVGITDEAAIEILVDVDFRGGTRSTCR